MERQVYFDNAWFLSEANSELMNSVAPNADWSSMGSTDHFVQLYETDEFLIGSVAEYVIHGLRTGDTCIVFATPEHRALLAERIEDHRRVLGAVFDDDRYIALDARGMLDKFLIDGLPDDALFEKVIGELVEKVCKGGRMRAFGEMVALLAAEGNGPALVKLEHLWNRLRSKCTFSLYCAYSMDMVANQRGDLMPGICGAHSRVIPGESYVSLRTADERLRAVAALQHYNRQLVAELAVLRHRIASRKKRAA